ncbi:putative transcriptional regulatory protein PB24D3.01, partial [Frankliniella fusca]
CEAELQSAGYDVIKECLIVNMSLCLEAFGMQELWLIIHGFTTYQFQNVEWFLNYINDWSNT